VDAVTEAYLQEIVNKEHKRRLQRLDQLKELYNTYDENLRKKRQALRDLAAKVGSGDAKTLALKHQFAIEQLHMAEKELMDIQSQLRKLQVEAADQQAQEKGSAELPVPDSAVEEQIEKDRIVQQYLKQVADLENRIKDLRVVSVRGGNEPIFRRYRADIESAKAAVAARRKEIRPQITEELRNKSRTELTANVAFLKSRGTLLYKHEKVLIDLIDRLRTETNSMNQSELNLGTLQDDIPRAENLFKTVAAELDALNVELQAPPRVSLLEGASNSQKDNKKRKALAAGMAAFGAFGLALFSVSWWEFRRQRVNTVDEVVHGLGGNLLGAVPHLPERARHSLVASNSLVPSNGTPDLYWQNLLIESVNTVRIMLLHAARIEPLRVIMVTSASGGEGKTSLSSHLALSLARSGRKVLLIDCDMRRPSVHRTFDHPLNPGFSELLCGQVDISVAVQPGPVNDLWLLPAGQSSSHAIEALAKEGAPSIFNRLREQFDFIVVDSCPILPVADSLLIAQHVDGVIFTMLREVSRLPQVYAGYQRLAALGVRILGIVVNGAGGDVYGSTYSEYQYLHPSSN
jgi:capsular exopolysaccharide synthesis family protein